MDMNTGEYLLHSAEQRAKMAIVEVGQHQSLRMALDAMGCDEHDPRIRDTNFDYPTTLRRELGARRKIKVICLSLDEDTLYGRVEGILSGDGLIPLTFLEFVDFLTDSRSWGMGNSFVCLGSRFMENPIHPGAILVPVVHQLSRQEQPVRLGRYFDLERVGRVWPMGTVFPAKTVEP